MSEGVAEKNNGNSVTPKFEHWVVWESCIVLKKNLSIVFTALLALAFVAAFELCVVSTLELHPMFRPGMPNLPFALLRCLPVIVVVYAVHATVFDNCSGWSAFVKEKRASFLAFGARVFLIFLILCVFGLFIQFLFIASGLKPGDHLTGGLAFIIIILSLPVVIGATVFSILFCTWPVSVVWSKDASFQRALKRGKKTFWYVIGRSLIVMLPMQIFQLAIAAIFLPAIVFFFGSGGTTEMISRFGLSISVSLIGSLVAILWCIMLAVTISRALIIGDARLDVDEEEGLSDAAG